MQKGKARDLASDFLHPFRQSAVFQAASFIERLPSFWNGGLLWDDPGVI